MPTLFPFQERAVDAVLNCTQFGSDTQRGKYLALACGTGKTITSIEAAKRYRQLTPIDQWGPHLVVVAPNVVIPQWVREIRRQDDPEIPISIWRTGKDVTRYKPGSWGYVIVHYDVFKRLLANAPEWVYRQWLTITADEAHALKGILPATKRQIITRTRADRIIPMSATPIQDTPIDVWAHLHWMDREKHRLGLHPWIKHFIEVEKVTTSTGRSFVQYNGVKNDPKIRGAMVATLRRYMLAVTKQEAAPDLPHAITTEMPIELLPKQRKLYDAIDKSLLRGIEFDHVKEGFNRNNYDNLIIDQVITQILRLLQVVCDPRLLDFMEQGSAKREWVDAYIEDNKNEQLVIFSQFRKVAQSIAKAHNGALVLGGQEPHLLNEFKSGSVQVLCCTYGAGSQGLDLPDAHTGIFYDRVWSSIAMEQAPERIDRIVRKDMVNPKHFIYLHAPKTVDDMVRATLDRKGEQIELVRRFLSRDYS